MGIEPAGVEPGSEFLPSLNTVWHFRPVDFLMARSGGAIVSQRVADAFREMDWTGAEFFPATVIRLAREPDFARLNALLLEHADDFRSIARGLGGLIIDERYFHLVVVGESRWIWPLISKCQTCGFRDYVPCNSAIADDQWLGHDIFRILPTKLIAVTERVKARLEGMKVEGVDFKRMGQL